MTKSGTTRITAATPTSTTFERLWRLRWIQWLGGDSGQDLPATMRREREVTRSLWHTRWRIRAPLQAAATLRLHPERLGLRTRLVLPQPGLLRQPQPRDTATP